MCPSEHQGLVHLDFRDTFPHVFWTSPWITEPDLHPQHRYKLLTVRHKAASKVQAVLLQEWRDGTKRIIQQFEGPLDVFDATDLSRSLEQWFHVSFEQVDMRSVKTFEEFEARARQIGWEAS